MIYGFYLYARGGLCLYSENWNQRRVVSDKLGMRKLMFGLLFSTVGMEVETATVRFTFGILELFDGLSLIPVAIGMLAVAEMLVQLGGLEALEHQQKMLRDNVKSINQNTS